MSVDLTPTEITRRLARIGFVDNAEPLSADHDRYSWCIPGNEPGVIDMLPGGVFEIYGSAEVIARIVSALGIAYTEEQVRQAVLKRLSFVDTQKMRWQPPGTVGRAEYDTDKIMAALRREGG